MTSDKYSLVHELCVIRKPSLYQLGDSYLVQMVIIPLPFIETPASALPNPRIRDGNLETDP